MEKVTKRNVTIEYFINKWLKDYHNTNLDEVTKLHPEWENNPREHIHDFYKKYAVTKEQHDEWHEWAIKEIMRIWRISKKRAERAFTFDYLNCAPNTKE